MSVIAASQPIVPFDLSKGDSVMNHSTPSVLQALQEAGLQGGQNNGQQGAPGVAQGAKQELQLADIHLAATPSAWPPAPGWWILLFLLLGLITFTVIKFIRYLRFKKHQTRILQALGQLEKTLNKDQSPEAIADVNILLRRLALAHYPRKKIASLTGQDWLKFLDKSGSTNDFSQGAGKLLADAPYLVNIPPSADIKGLSLVVKKWVKQISGKKQARAKHGVSGTRKMAHT